MQEVKKRSELAHLGDFHVSSVEYGTSDSSWGVKVLYKARGFH